MAEQVSRVTVMELGDCMARVWSPENLPAPEVTLTFRPKTIAEFEMLLEAVGGIEFVRFPERFAYWDDPAWARSPDGLVRAMIYPPPRDDTPEPPRDHPFYAAYLRAQQALAGGVAS